MNLTGYTESMIYLAFTTNMHIAFISLSTVCILPTASYSHIFIGLIGGSILGKTIHVRY